MGPTPSQRVSTGLARTHMISPPRSRSSVSVWVRTAGWDGMPGSGGEEREEGEVHEAGIVSNRI